MVAVAVLLREARELSDCQADLANLVDDVQVLVPRPDEALLESAREVLHVGVDVLRERLAPERCEERLLRPLGTMVSCVPENSLAQNDRDPGVAACPAGTTVPGRFPLPT